MGKNNSYYLKSLLCLSSSLVMAPVRRLYVTGSHVGESQAAVHWLTMPGSCQRSKEIVETTPEAETIWLSICINQLSTLYKLSVSAVLSAVKRNHENNNRGNNSLTQSKEIMKTTPEAETLYCSQKKS